MDAAWIGGQHGHGVDWGTTRTRRGLKENTDTAWIESKTASKRERVHPTNVKNSGKGANIVIESDHEYERPERGGLSTLPDLNIHFRWTDLISFSSPLSKPFLR